MKLSDKGFTPDTLDELKFKAKTYYQQSIFNFTDSPASFQEGVIDLSAVNNSIAQQAMELGMDSLGVNEASYAQLLPFAQLCGLDIKKETMSSVDVIFTSENPNLAIPKDFEVSTPDKLFSFFVPEGFIIGTTLVKTVKCYSKEPYQNTTPPNTVSEISKNIVGLTVINENASVPSTEAETEAEFSDRIIRYIQTQRPSSTSYLEGELLRIDGTTPNNISINYDENGKLEVIILGGDENEIAEAIFRATSGHQQGYTSNPSGGETNRTRIITFHLNNGTYVVKFTLAKTSTLNMAIAINLSTDTPSSIISLWLYSIIEDFISKLPIGAKVNKNTLDNIIFDALGEKGLKTNQIISIGITMSKNGTTLEFDNANFIPILSDEKIILGELTFE